MFQEMSDKLSIHSDNVCSKNNDSDDNNSGGSGSEMTSSEESLSTMPNPGPSKCCHCKVNTTSLVRVSNLSADQGRLY